MTEPTALTQAIRAGIETDRNHGAVVLPVYSSTNYTFAALGEPREFDYTRSGNPTRALLGEAIAKLEGGAGATVVATGMAAVLLPIVALLRAGDTVAYPHDCYGGSWRQFEQLASKGLYQFEPVDFSDAEAARTRLQQLKPALVWLETPSNPLLRITDLRAVTSAAHEIGALVVADNTFLTPLLQQPFEFGVDVVVHSVTKYLNGHSDVVQGAVVAKSAEHAELFDWWGNVLGLTASPVDSHQVLRGLRTLEVRVERHQRNAQDIVAAIAEHPAITRINYPGLTAHPQHELAAQQQRGFGAMLSIELAGGLDAVRKFVDSLQLFSLAESLGGTESLVAHPATMTHASMTPEAQEAAGISAGLVRISVGIEPVADLIADLQRALDVARN
ncbi:cystathionine gamma-synthase [Gulosibacter hominis]|uniref:cystathionine gamma-synthase n=1 Tax=Gulosibacter hominis TaxID=2770504 RepID=UPI0019189D94|nr:cystathionine gamma-synthase [Gulosibacter hominis]